MSKNKDEEIKLYLNAITKRDPSKRQIKPVDKDAFQLFDDIESGSDEDFVVGSDDFSDDQQIEESEEENENSKADDGNDSDDTSDTNVSDKVEENTKKRESETILDNLNDYRTIANKTKFENVMICMMCLLDSSFSDNELVECDGCGIVVHEDCYKISDSVFMSDDSSDSSTYPWFCDACLSNVSNPRCELCPVEEGVFKRTENNRWVHLLCALYTPGVAFNDTETLSEITLSELPLKDWSARECGLCANPFFARTGICISCDAGLCKNVFHVLCAQKEGLLSEPNNEENSDDPYFANCRQHTDKETVKRRRKNWNAAVNRQKLRLEEWHNNNHYNDSRLIRKRQFFSSMHSKFLELVPTPFVPKTKVACFLETNPIAVFLFKKKATNLRLPQDVLNSQTSNDLKTISSGIPVFGPDFITYFLDREKKIDETSREIVQLENFRRELQISEQNTSHQFNKTVAKKESAEKEFKLGLEQVALKFDIIKQLVKHRELMEVINNLLAKFQIPTNGSTGNGNESLVSGADKETSATNTKTKPDSVINECYMCKSVSDQHMLIDCDNCHKFIHIGCLDPPLTRMPRKTKLYGWQCSLCSCATTDDEHAKNLDVNRPRQLRRSNDLRSKYSRHEEISSTEKFSRKILKRTKQRSIINQTVRPKPRPVSPTPPEKVKTPTKLEEVLLEPPVISHSPVNSTNETPPDCSNVPESEAATDNSNTSKPPHMTGQRKSDRSRKRPLTLLDEYETTVKRKRPNLQNVIKSMQIRRKSAPIKADVMRSRLPKVAKVSKSFSSQSNETAEPKSQKQSQPITFYPSSEPPSVSSKQSSESEHVQIGVVAKKPISLSRDSNSGTQKGFEKKSILIKCHDENDDDDERLTATETLARFSGTG